MSARFPFPSLPVGWFAVAVSNELAVGEVKTVHYFGQDIVLYRDAAGVARAVDPYCPHLGAHLGHGGKVDGSLIRCPFHAWGFGPDGKCEDVPRCDAPPRNVSVRPWPIEERYGVIFVFHHPERQAPTWSLDETSQEGWTPRKLSSWTIGTQPQEVAENVIDVAHLEPVHGFLNGRVGRKPRVEGHLFHAHMLFTAPAQSVGSGGQDSESDLSVTLKGLGVIFAEVFEQNTGLEFRQWLLTTPIDAERSHVRLLTSLKRVADEGFTAMVAEEFHKSFILSFEQDIAMWEHKVFLERPRFAKNDGPFGVYRGWAKQFYVAKAAVATQAGGGLVSLSSLTHRLRALKEEAAARVEQWRDRAASGQKSQPEAAPPAASPKVNPALVVDSAQHYFSTLGERFVSDAAKDVDAVIEWRLSGDGGGTYHAIVRDGRMQLVEGSHANATTVLSMSADDYVKMVNGQLNGARAFMTGRGKIAGNVKVAMKMGDIFPPAARA